MFPKVLKFTIPNIPPSNNLFIGRKNIWGYQEIKKEWVDWVGVFCKPLPDEPLSDIVVTLTYFFETNRRRDPDNYSGKMILDAMKENGIIKDDSFNEIDLHIKQGGFVKRGEGFTLVEIAKR